MRKSDYTQLLKVLDKKAPDRPTLYEFFLNQTLHIELAADEAPIRGDAYDHVRRNMYAFKNAGYDYVTQPISNFHFVSGERDHMSTISLNEGSMITDWETYEKYKWNEPEDFDDSFIELLAKDLPEGMKFIPQGPCGVLENVIRLVGYDHLCIMIFEEPKLAELIFNGVGSRLLRYYEMAAAKESVMAMVGNDDWGFKTQTMLSPEDMRKYVFPWYKKIVDAAHKHGKPVILHSCGYAGEIIDDIIDSIGFDGKHSYEDTIQPIEEAYEQYKGRVALLGGIDVGFVCTATPEEVAKRSRGMIERSASAGCYALGTGNSVPEYVPKENYYAMIDVVRKGEY